jgi:beta-lactamase class A
MRDEPAGERFTLRHYAEQMISVSDNTATDHLIGRLGRAAVEAQLAALGNHAIAANRPFLTTRELFALKLAAPRSLREAFARGDSQQRRRLLGQIGALRPTIASADSWRAPRSIRRIEWFASPAELTHAITSLVTRAREPALAPLRAILSGNPGIPLDRSRWPYVAFKGGSEPGVLSLTWYLERRDRRAFALSIVLNDDHDEIDAAAATAIAEAAIKLLSRA